MVEQEATKNRRKVLLQAVLEELVSVKESVELDLKSAHAIRTSVLHLLRASLNSSTLSSQETIRLLSDTTWFNTASVYEVPVLTSLVSSGDLSIVSDPSLRLELGKWAGNFKALSEIISRDADFIYGKLLPFYSERDWLVQALDAVDCKPGAPSICWSYGERLDVVKRNDHASLISDPEFRGMLAERLLTLSDSIDFALEELGQELDVVLQNIRNDLEK